MKHLVHLLLLTLSILHGNEVVMVGNLNRGIAASDPSQESGYIMYTEEAVASRFASPPSANNAEHLICVRYDGSDWFYDDNSTNNPYKIFTSVETDLLLYAVDFANDIVTSLVGTDSEIGGVAMGMLSTDLEIFPNIWNGSANDGEFAVTGSQFIRNASNSTTDPVDVDTPEDLGTIDVYVLSGQSNMSGRVDTGYTHIPEVDDNILYYYRTDGPASVDQTSGGNFTTLTTLDTGYYGLEISMARELYTQAANPMAIIKVSDGGTKLATDWNPNSTSGNTWYQHWMTDVPEALSKLVSMGYTPNIKGLVWFQGEGDSESYGNNSYATDFTTLLNNMLLVFNNYTPSADIQVVTSLIQNRYVKNAAVRDAQMNVMNTNTHWFSVETNDLTTFDGTHLDEASVKKIGYRIGRMLHNSPELTLTLTLPTSEEFNCWYTGNLYSSSDAVNWTLVDPPVPPPFKLHFSETGDHLFRAEK